ncbi:MAG: hypothetical protein U1F27_08020 [Turneriella sp.]
MQEITVSQLKAHLSAEIKKLKKNGGVQIVQRDVAVARLLPIAENTPLTFQRKTNKNFKLLKPVVEMKGDPIAILLEERQKDRQ